MTVEELYKKYESVSIENGIGIIGLNISDDVFCMLACEESGILPHDIPNHSLVYFDKKAEYKKGDYIAIKDKRVGTKMGLRITRAISEKDKDFQGRLMMCVRIF